MCRMHKNKKRFCGISIEREGIIIDKKIATEKLYEKILDWFRQQLISGELKEGETIPSERELATQFGVSRVPVREALRILEYIGIISNGPEGMQIQRVDFQILNPKVNFASKITKETIISLMEVRMFLESGAAYYAALRRTDEDLNKMRACIRQMSKALENPNVDEETLIRSSHDFHFCVIEATKNPVLENMYRNLYDLLEISKQYTMNKSSVSDSTLMDHEAILYKIESCNPDEASRYMKFHLNRALMKVPTDGEKQNRE